MNLEGVSERRALGRLCAHWMFLLATGCSSPDEGASPSGADGGGAPSAGGSGGQNSGGSVATSGGAAGRGSGGASGSGTGGRASGGTSGSGGSASGTGGSSGAAPVKPASATCTVTPGVAPSTSWVNATGNLAGQASECGNLTLLAADPCSSKVIAGVAKGGLWATTDGSTWTKLGTGSGSADIVHRPSSIVFDPEHPDVFYESGIYGALNDGIHKTTDGGTTFTKLGDIGHNDLVSVDFSDPERKTLLAGAHETKQRLYRSTDGGASWDDIGDKLPADSHFSSAPLVLDARHFLLGACGWGDGACGVFASDDAGETWSKTSSEGPSGRPLWASDGHLLWTTIWDSGAILSQDLGKTWGNKVNGLHSGFPVELPDGRIVAVGGDHLVISTDGGSTWSNIGEPLPYPPAGVTYSVATKKVFIWRNDCGDAVLADAVMSAGFDYEQ